MNKIGASLVGENVVSKLFWIIFAIIALVVIGYIAKSFF